MSAVENDAGCCGTQTGVVERQARRRNVAERIVDSGVGRGRMFAVSGEHERIRASTAPFSQYSHCGTRRSHHKPSTESAIRPVRPPTRRVQRMTSSERGNGGVSVGCGSKCG